jgi:predicted acetyltransferase
MDVQLVEANESDLPLLDNLAQLYQYDFSEFDGSDIGDDGRFDWVDWRALFEKPNHHVFRICVDGRTAGFASVYKGHAFRDEGESVWWMDEFFVMRSFRDRGVGERVARMLFDAFPGTWEIAQIRPNVGAQAFWRKVIGRYTEGTFEEFDIRDHRWDGPVQLFHAGDPHARDGVAR